MLEVMTLQLFAVLPSDSAPHSLILFAKISDVSLIVEVASDGISCILLSMTKVFRKKLLMSIIISSDIYP